MSGRCVLRYRGEGPAPGADVDRIRQLPGVIIVDETPRMLLVECEEGPLRELISASPDWVMAPERAVELPDTRKQVRRPPEH